MIGRRTFLRLFGTTAAAAPLAAKGALDSEIGRAAGFWNTPGLGDASLGISSGGRPPAGLGQATNLFVSYEERLARAGEHIKLFGLPKFLEAQLRDQARYVSSLDPDIAAKRSWSMAVKIGEQRQRNYQRARERIEMSGWCARGRQAVGQILGFDWPW
jgi:hypothetical protein